MKHLPAYLTSLVILAGSAAFAQSDDEGGFLERLIEDSLSGDDRDVVIEGFQGLLSGQATFDRMTISDRDGVWLTVTDAKLDWQRLALLRSRLSVSVLTAQSIDFARPPLPPEAELPAPEAAESFSLPDLPVAIRIDEISVDRLRLGETLFGQEAEMSLAGSAALEGGEGNVSVEAERLDGVGVFAVNGSYANATDILKIDVTVDEAADGIVVNLIDVPGLPALELELTGEGPLTDYAADIRLATDGTDRLTGQVASRRAEIAGAEAQEFTAAIAGDVTPLFAPEYREFFGTDLALDASATRLPDGMFDVTQFDLSSEALTLSGNVAIGPEGLPLRAKIDGEIAAGDGEPVLLPVPGDQIRIDAAAINASFDTQSGNEWRADISVRGLEGVGYSAEQLTLAGTGELKPLSPDRFLNGTIDIGAMSLDLGDDDMDRALGKDVTADIVFAWSDGEPLELSEFVVDGRDYGLSGKAQISGFGDGFDVVASARAQADDLSAFSGIARTPLAGAITADLTANIEALTGQFDVAVAATSSDLTVGQPEIDNVLAGEAEFQFEALRDPDGLRIDAFRLESPHAKANGSANLNSRSSSVSLTAALDDLALVLPDISGPVQLEAKADETEGVWTFTADARAPGVVLEASGSATDLNELPSVTGSISAEASDLSKYAQLVDIPLTGGASFNGEIAGRSDLSQLSVDLTGELKNLGIGQAQFDDLLAGSVDARLAGELNDDVVSLGEMELNGQNVKLDASGSYGSGDGTLSASLVLPNTDILIPEASGRTSLRALATEGANESWAFELVGNGPVLTLDADGNVRPFDTPAVVDADLVLEVPNLEIFADLAQMPVAGAISISGEIAGAADLSSARVDVSGSSSNIRTGIVELDKLLSGDGTLRLDALIEGDTIEIGEARVELPQISAEASGGAVDGIGTLEFGARLADLAPIVPSFPGPVTVAGAASLDGTEQISVNVSGTGPGGITATSDGTVAKDLSTVGLSVNGRGPLALGNSFVEPISLDGEVGFDLGVNGPPALESVTGTVSTSGARLVIPDAGIILENISLNTQLAAGSAQVQADASVSSGGRISVSGPVALTPPFSGSINADLSSVVLTDGALYETSLSGNVVMDGALAGGAQISGQIDVGETEINIAASSAGASGSIPDIIHLNEPASVRQTRQYAGLVRQEEAARSGGGPVYPLDVQIDASRIFVRGRGLDAELAGALRVTGTTASVTPVGEIDLIRGRLNLLGSRLRVVEGSIALQGSLVPVLRLSAVSDRRSDDGVDTFVTVDGPVTNPSFSFESDPSLPEDEVLARLLFGTDLSNISALQAAQLASAAATLSGGGGGRGLVSGLREGLGVDDLDFRTDEQGRTAVTAGAYLNEDIYADVTTRSDGETELNLNFDLTDSITLKGSTINTGESKVGVFFLRDY